MANKDGSANTIRPEPITPATMDARAAEAVEELAKFKGKISPGLYRDIAYLLEDAEAETEFEARASKIYIALTALYNLRTVFLSGESTENAQDLLKSIRPQKAIINNSKVANQLSAIAQAGIANVSVDKGAKGKQKVLVEFNTDAATIDGKPLNIISPYEQTVFNAICTLLEAGNDVFSLDMVYRAMNGLTNSERVNADFGTLDPIRDSIDASAKRRITITTTTGGKEYIYKSQLLPIKELTVRKPQTGETVTAYKLLDEPALYTYSKSIKQIISVPIGLLDTKTIKKNSAKLTVVREYLIKRISSMKNSKASANSRKIKYSKLFSETGIDENAMAQAERNRERKYIALILEDFKAKGFISEFSEYKAGRSFDGVEIKF